MNYRVEKDRTAVIHPWLVKNPEGKEVWRTSNQGAAYSLARMFARRAALLESIRSRGLRVTEVP